MNGEVKFFDNSKKKCGGGGSGRGAGGLVSVEVNEELKFLCENSKKKIEGGCECFCENSKKKKGGGQGRCVGKSEVFVKIKKKWWGVGSGGGRVGSQGGCERRSFVKIKKQKSFGGGGVWSGGGGWGSGLM